MTKPTIPVSGEPFMRDGKNSPFWTRFFEGLTAAYNLTADGVAGGLAAIADVWAATPNQTFTTGLLETASAYQTLSESELVSGADWDGGYNRETTLTANRAIGSPINAQPGTFRQIYLVGNSGTLRTVTFDANFKGDVPTLTDITSSKAYLLVIHCKTTSHFVVSSKRAL